MKLPHVEEAEIAEAKLSGYLLSLTHRDGRGKALFFIRFGFVLDAPDILADALRQHAHENEVAKIEQTPFGTRYVLEGPLRAPNGRAPNLRVVWFVEQGQAAPRLATAYPLAEAEEQKREGQDDQGTG